MTSGDVVVAYVADLLGISTRDAAKLGMAVVLGHPGETMSGWQLAREIVRLWQERGGNVFVATTALSAIAAAEAEAKK